MSAAPVVFSAVPTLFGPDGELDPDANRALHKLLASQLDGLLVAGTTGEFPALDDAERLTLIELALAEAGPERVIAHIGAPDARHASRLAQAAVALGATRIAAITPYYLAVRPDELTAHYRAIRDAAPDPELYAYIFPERTSVHVPPEEFARVADAAGLAGAKISGAAAADLEHYVAAAPGLRFYSGDDANPAATMRAGGAGVISGRSSAYPEVYAALRHEATDPEVQPRSAQPGSAQPGSAQPGSAQPGSAQPGSAQPGSAQPGSAQPGSAQQLLDRIVALGASTGRLKYALQLRGLGGGTARMTVDPPDESTAAAIAEIVSAL